MSPTPEVEMGLMALGPCQEGMPAAAPLMQEWQGERKGSLPSSVAGDRPSP